MSIFLLTRQPTKINKDMLTRARLYPILSPHIHEIIDHQMSGHTSVEKRSTMV